MAEIGLRQRQQQVGHPSAVHNAHDHAAACHVPAKLKAFAQDLPSPQAASARPSNSLSSSCSDWPSQDNTEGVKVAFDHLVGEDGLLGLEQLSSLLQDVGLQAPSDVVLGLVEARASTQWALTFDET